MGLVFGKGASAPKTDRELLVDILKMLGDISEQLEELDDRVQDIEGGKGHKEELKEVKDENKSYRLFMQDVMYKLIDVKAAQSAKPSALEAYQMRKAEEAKAEAAKPNGQGHKPKLPG